MSQKLYIVKFSLKYRTFYILLKKNGFLFYLAQMLFTIGQSEITQIKWDLTNWWTH